MKLLGKSIVLIGWIVIAGCSEQKSERYSNVLQNNRQQNQVINRKSPESIQLAENVDEVILKNISVINPRKRTVEVKNLAMQGGKIIDESQLKGTAKVYDMTGKFVMPGLIDMHVHAGGNSGLSGAYQYMGGDGTSMAMLYSGVTAFLDLFTDKEVMNLRNRQRREGLIRPDIFAAGPCLTRPKGHCDFDGSTPTASTPAEARKAVQAAAQSKPDVIKLVYDHPQEREANKPTFDKATMQALIDEARKLGIKTVAHIGDWKDARELIEAGVSALTHLYAEPIPNDLVTLIKTRNIFMIPTMAVMEDELTFNEQPNLLNQPLLKATVAPNVLNSYKTGKLDAWLKDWLSKSRKASSTTVKKLANAGVIMAMGSDMNNPGVFAGYSVHREMQLLSKAGVNKWDILTGATTAAGDFLGQRYGVEPGDTANLLVLNQSPLVNISNTQGIHKVIYRGKPLIRENVLQLIPKKTL